MEEKQIYKLLLDFIRNEGKCKFKGDGNGCLYYGKLYIGKCCEANCPLLRMIDRDEGA